MVSSSRNWCDYRLADHPPLSYCLSFTSSGEECLTFLVPRCRSWAPPKLFKKTGTLSIITPPPPPPPPPQIVVVRAASHSAAVKVCKCMNEKQVTGEKVHVFCPQTQFGQTGQRSVNTPVCDLLWDLFDLLLFDWNLKSASCSSLILTVTSLSVLLLLTRFLSSVSLHIFC